MPKRSLPHPQVNNCDGLLQKPARPALAKKVFPPQLPDHGLPVDYDEQFFQYETQIPYDDNAAEHLLRIIIYYLETNKPLPYGIRDYLYRAFKETICAEPSKRPMVLASKLGLIKSRQRPLLTDPIKIGGLVAGYIKDSIGKTKSMAKVAKDTGLSQSTVRGHYKKYLEDEADFKRVRKIEARLKAENNRPKTSIKVATQVRNK